MSRQQSTNGERRSKVDLRLKRRQDNTFRYISEEPLTFESGSASYTCRARDVSHSNSEVASTSQLCHLPRLPPSRLITAVEQNGDEPREKRNLLEILAEGEESKKRNMIWTRLPPPNVELYTRKPVVLLNWDDLDNVTSEEIAANLPSRLEELKEEAMFDVDSIPDDDSFSNLSQLTATLESAGRQFGPIALQDKAELCGFESAGEVSQSANLAGEGKHIPPPPDFNDNDNDDEYDIGSDMDLFGDEEMDSLYDDVDQQLKQENFISVGDSPDDSTRSISGQLSSEGILPEAISPIGIGVQSLSRVATDVHQSSNSGVNSVTNAGPAVAGRMIQPIVSSTPLSRAGDSSNFQPQPQPPMSGKRETCEGTIGGFSINSLTSLTDIRTPWVRSYSSESKLSPDSEDLDLPPVDWGPSQTSAATESVGDEPKPHCIKDTAQAPPTSPPPPCPQPVTRECPICTTSFPRSYTQLQVDEHVAVCLSAMDWEEDFN